jgi:hypothetical protein
MSDEEWLGEVLQDLFDAVRSSETISGAIEHRCVYIRNEDTNIYGLLDPVMWLTEQTVDGVIYELAAAPEGLNGIAEKLNDAYDWPAGDFTGPVVKDEAIALATMVQYDAFPIWMRRIVTAGASEQFVAEAEICVEAETREPA